MDVSETDLPGVGKRFDVELSGGGTAVVLVHNTGRRELFVRPEPDADAEELLELTDEEARMIGSILEGAHFQPRPAGLTETTIGDDVILEWYELEAGAPLVGRTIGEVDVRKRTGVTVAAIEREGAVVQSPGPDFEFDVGDQLIVVGSGADHEAFRELCS